MTYSYIETFLEVVRTRNITSAAHSLYLSQSTVSNRLKNLEDELGFQLLVRNKGKQFVELTQKGQEFIVLAERWKSLYEEAEALKHSGSMKLRIAVNESSYYSCIMQVIDSLLEKNAKIRFDVKICDSEQIYDLVDDGLYHLGCASCQSESPRLIVQEIDRQELCIITADIPEYDSKELNISQLRPEKELRFSGGHFEGMEKWRQHHLGYVSEPPLIINGGFLMIFDKILSGSWALIPYDMAVFMARRAPIRVHRLTDNMDMEDWRLFMIRRKDESSEYVATINLFVEELRQFLNTKRGI